MATRATRRNPPSAASASSPPQVAKGSRGRSKDPGDGENATNPPGRAARRGRPPKSTAGSELPIVAESSSMKQSSIRDKRNRKSSGVASAMSGTTVRTSLTEQEIAGMSSEDMIEELPTLEYASGIILDLLAPQNISVQAIGTLVQELKNPTTRAHKNLTKNRKELNAKKERFGNGPLINVSVAVRGIIGVKTVDELSVGFWRPDEILHKANLAATIEDLYARLEDTNHTFSLEKLDREFPEPYLSRLNAGTALPGSSTLFKETFELALEVRTQFALQVLREQVDEPSFDPHSILQQIFYGVDAATTVRGWDVDGLRGRTLKPNQRQAISKRLNEINGKLADGAVDFNAFSDSFPFLSFVQRYLAWARSRVEELNSRINAAGNGAGIQRAIEAEIRRRNDITSGQRASEQIDAMPLNLQEDNASLPEPAVSIPQSDIVPGHTAAAAGKHFKKLKRQGQNGAQQQHGNTARISLNQAPTAPMFTSNPSPMTATEMIDPLLLGGDQGTDRDQHQPPLQTSYQAQLQAAAQAANAYPTSHEEQEMIQAILAKHSQDLREADKENNPEASAVAATLRHGPSLLDRQPGATRVQWDTQETTQGVNGSLDLPSPSALVAPEEDAFEEDQRPVSGHKRKRKSASSRSSAPNAKKSRFAEINASDSVPMSSPYPSGTPQNIDTYPENIRPYYVANVKAKQETVRKNLNKPPQKRRPWSIEETSLLQELIEEIGTSWASIKKYDEAHDKVFATRDQVALKDKARNMKFDLLKAHSTLPMNFEFIPLKASQKQDLLNHGVDVDAMQRAAAIAASQPTPA